MTFTIAGAGMAGLSAAARARELGLDVVVHEKGDRAGGSMLLSSCVVFRHRTLDGFREDCPDGDPALQRIVVEELDDALAWLESLGAPVLTKETGNPRTVGWRFDPVGLTEALVRAAGHVRLGSPFPAGSSPLLLATGGFAGRLARERGLALRANPWSEGDGLDEGLRRGGSETAGMDEFYGRAMPAPPARWRESDFVRASQLYGRYAEVRSGKARSPGTRTTWCRSSPGVPAGSAGTASPRASSPPAFVSERWRTWWPRPSVWAARSCATAPASA